MRAIYIHLPTATVRVTRDSEKFDESKHPRATNGQFGSGSGSGPSSKELGGGLKAHPKEKMREYTSKELDWEYGTEYLKYSKNAFPDAFKSREDFQKKYDDAPLVHLTDKELATLENSMAYSGKNKGEDWVHKTFSHRRDSKRIVNEMKNEKTAPPIILKKDGRLRLMAGQTRLATGLALGMSVPAKIITVDRATSDEKPFDESKHPRAANGQFGTGSGGTSTTKVDHAEKVYKATSAPTKGTTAERVALRKLLKEPGLPDKYKTEIKNKILDSFKTQHAMVVKKGNHAKAAELAGKMQKLGWKPPAPQTIAQANANYAPKVVEGAKSVMQAELPKPASGQYSPQETADFNDLVSLVGEFSAKIYVNDAKIRLADYPEIASKLSLADATVIVAYSGHSYKETNSQLRSGVVSEETLRHADKLDAALGKLPSYNGQVVRDTTLPEDIASLYAPGKIINSPGFTSTSRNIKSGAGPMFKGNVKYMITSKTGKDISKLSNHPNEQEVLFRTGTRFKITHVKHVGNKREIFMEEIENGRR